MNCPLRNEETAHILLDYSAGRLDATRAVVLERHLRSCPDCAAFRMEQTAVWDALNEWRPAPVSIDFNRRLWQRIDAADAAPWYLRLFQTIRFVQWQPVLPLTAAILVIAAGFLLDHPADRVAARNAPAAPSVSVTEADQVEQTLDDIQLLRQLNAEESGKAKTIPE
jgi:anti-sigma factor RsiW